MQGGIDYTDVLWSVKYNDATYPKLQEEEKTLPRFHISFSTHFVDDVNYRLLTHNAQWGKKIKSCYFVSIVLFTMFK